MASSYVFGGTSRQIVAFLRPDDSKSIAIYPNAHDSQDSISICWSKGLKEAEELANDILAAVRVIRAHDLACPKCLAEAGNPCAKDDPDQVTEPAHTERLDTYDRSLPRRAR